MLETGIITIDFLKTLQVFGDGDIKQFIVFPKLHANDRMDTGCPAPFYEVIASGGVVDVGKGQGLYAHAFGQGDQFFRGERSVAEAEVGMAV